MVQKIELLSLLGFMGVGDLFVDAESLHHSADLLLTTGQEGEGRLVHSEGVGVGFQRLGGIPLRVESHQHKVDVVWLLHLGPDLVEVGGDKGADIGTVGVDETHGYRRAFQIIRKDDLLTVLVQQSKRDVVIVVKATAAAGAHQQKQERGQEGKESQPFHDESDFRDDESACPAGPEICLLNRYGLIVSWLGDLFSRPLFYG